MVNLIFSEVLKYSVFYSFFNFILRIHPFNAFRIYCVRDQMWSWFYPAALVVLHNAFDFYSFSNLLYYINGHPFVHLTQFIESFGGPYGCLIRQSLLL